MKNFEDFNVGDYLSIFRRRIWYIIVTAVLVTAGTIVYVWRLPSIYRSEATIAIASRFLPEDYIRSIVRETTTERVEMVKQQLQSQTYLQRIAREFQLGGSDPERADVAAKAILLANMEITTISANVMKIGFKASDPNMAQAITRRLTESVIQLNDSFQKERVYEASQFLGDEQRQAQEKLKDAEEKLRQYNLRNFPGIGQQEIVTAAALSAQQDLLARLDKNFEDAQNRKRALIRRQEERQQLRTLGRTPPPAQIVEPQVLPGGLPNVPQLSPLEQRLRDKKAELAAAALRYTAAHPTVISLTREVSELEAQVARAPVQASVQTASTTPNKRPETAPAPALPSFTADLDLLSAEIQLELDKVNSELAKLERDRKEVGFKISIYQARMNPSLELTELTRQYDDAKQRYSVVSQQRLNSEISGRVDTNENNELFRVIDAANLPRAPISPNRPLFAGVGVIFGLVLGLLFAFVRDLLEPGLRNESDAVAEFKLPVLTSIPVVADATEKTKPSNGTDLRAVSKDGPFSLKTAEGAIKSVLLDTRSLAGEQYRLMRAKLGLLQKQKRLKSLLVTSAIPNDGKTFIASCLAGILAQEPYKRVLLIDADLRRASARKALGINNDACVYNLNSVLQSTTTDPDYLNFLRDLWVGSGEGEDITSLSVERLLKSPLMNLYFLPAGTLVGNPAELLSSPVFEKLIRQAEEYFDWVIIDSPPVLAFADARILSEVCGGTILVVSSSRTPVPLVKDAIQTMGSDRICGVVMNRVRDLKANSYFKDYYEQVEK